jgi:hypothetical protein
MPAEVQRTSSSYCGLLWAKRHRAQKAPSVTVVSRMSMEDSERVPFVVLLTPKGIGRASGMCTAL